MDPTFAARISAERDMVLSSTVFQRSPVLSGLLRYLVEQTILGRASTLKSFIVAVDALGRKEDFDSASDSSARVQMGRLRKILEGYYAANAPSDGGCIYLLSGSYIVRLDSREVAYPALPPLPSKAEAPANGPMVIAGSPAVTGDRALPFYRRGYNWLLLLLGTILLTAAVGYFAQNKAAVTLVRQSPILEITPVDGGTDANAMQRSRMIISILADDLSRFKLSRVRLADGSTAKGSANAPANLYRLHARLVAEDADNFTLYLNIDDAQSDVLIWSRVLNMPADPATTRKMLVPIMAEINGPQGIIASYESVLVRSSDEGGYPCLLKYFEFARFHSEILEERVANCLKKPVTEQTLIGTMLGVQAMFEMERSNAVQDSGAAYRRGIVLARAAVKADPNDGWANFAMARLSYLQRDCDTARFYTERTVQANPNSPVFSSVLAGLAPMCRFPFAGKLLDQAIATQSPYYAKARLLLVLSAIAQNRPEKIDEIYVGELPLSRDNRSNYYLTEALIAASRAQRADATRYWQLFEANAPKQNATPDEKLRNIISNPAARMQVMLYLQKAGVPLVQKTG